MTAIQLLFLLCPIILIIPPIMIIVVKTTAKTIGWSIVLHITTLLPAAWIWIIISMGYRDAFVPGMLITFFCCSLYCGPFIIYRSKREKKSNPITSPN